MNVLKYLSPIFLVLILSYPAKLQAQSEFLGEFSQSMEKKEFSRELVLIIDGEKNKVLPQSISTWIAEKPKLSFDPGYRSEIENSNFCAYQKSIVCRLAFSYKNQANIRKTYTRETNQHEIESFIKDLARKSNKDPKNAKLKMENGKVSAFSLSSYGIRIKEEESVEAIEKYLTSKDHPAEIRLPFEKIQPEISTDSIDNLGITNLVGEGHSNFAGSTRSRIHNIKVAVNRFDGLLIKPGEEFSFVENLGEVDGEHGYLPELVIKKDKTEPEFGGGVCQVSTTVFRAAINSGLEITARRNHAYPVQYYNPQGMDATVYVPRPDLRFKNNTPGHILIEAIIEGTELTFNFYGTDDGRKIEVVGPTILEKNPDGSMKTTFTQRVFDKEGSLVMEDIFNSAYDSPSKYPHPESSEEVLTKKPKNWSDREWKNYKKAHGI